MRQVVAQFGMLGALALGASVARAQDSGPVMTANLSISTQTIIPPALVYFPPTFREAAEDTARRSSRRSVVSGAVVGGVIGGLASAGYILNATAYHCVTFGPPCPKKNYLLLHTVTIAAGTAAGAFIGARVGRWIGRRM